MIDSKRIAAHMQRQKWMKDLFPDKTIVEQHLGLMMVWVGER